MNISPRLTATTGLVGAAAMFVGDMLLYGHLGSGSDFDVRSVTVISTASDARLYAAGLLGPVAAFGYVIGALHLYARVSGAIPRARIILASFFAAVGVFAAAIHAVWGSYALAIRSATANPATQPFRQELRSYLGVLYTAGEIIGYPAMLLLLLLVLGRRTSYPPWTALANPGLLLLLSTFAVALPAPVGSIVVGGAFNLSFILFFVVSLATVRDRAT